MASLGGKRDSVLQSINAANPANSVPVNWLLEGLATEGRGGASPRIDRHTIVSAITQFQEGAFP